MLHHQQGNKKECTKQRKYNKETISAQREQIGKLTNELEKAHLRGNLLTEKLVEFETFTGSLFAIIKPLIPATPTITGTIDELTIEKLIDKKINSLPAKKRQKIETPGETGIPWVDMWLPKLRTKAERRIVTLLAEKIGTPLTKTQIALALAYAEKGGSFNSALNGLVKRYKLVIKDGDAYRIAEAPT